jgi:16S rRNA (uracil1498-N3)-methyltransferase
MPAYDFRAPRLYVDHPLAAGVKLALDGAQTNYLRNALRLRPGDQVLAFNGHDGEWRTALLDGGKRALFLVVEEVSRAQTPALDLHYWFAPLKHARLDYMVQKAVEMGAARLQPVLTRFTQVARVNGERMRANVVEAAEQCGILSLATVGEPIALDRYLGTREERRLLVFCDEAADLAGPIQTLQGEPAVARGIDVLIGPEGGFAAEERALLLRQKHILRISLGPRILRADTAAVAALALVQAVLGDWTGTHLRG